MPRLSDIAVVVPVGPGDTAWRGLLPLLSGLPDDAQRVLSLVAGDAQPTKDIDPAVIVQRGAAGRGRQQNAGAAASSRPWLWFLHADSRFDGSALGAIERFAEAPALAYFDLRFHDGGPLMAINQLGAWWRSRLLRMPFGDQGFLLPRAAFEALGGFDERLSSGEDHALVWAARRVGLPLRPLRAALSTSARKYVERGWWRTTAAHLRLSAAQARQFAGGKQ